jgi:hypothetical protein
MTAGQASNSDARKRLAEKRSVGVDPSMTLSGNVTGNVTFTNCLFVPAQGDVIESLRHAANLNENGSVIEFHYPNGAVSGRCLTPAETEFLVSRLAPAARPEHEVKAEALREAAEINVAASPSFAAWLERFAARIESESTA